MLKTMTRYGKKCASARYDVRNYGSCRELIELTMILVENKAKLSEGTPSNKNRKPSGALYGGKLASVLSPHSMKSAMKSGQRTSQASKTATRAKIVSGTLKFFSQDVDDARNWQLSIPEVMCFL